MKSKLWIMGYLILVIIPLAIVASWVIRVDPYFHYHKPNTARYFYSLYNQRSQNDGISRNFEYEGLITGTSMTENFKTSEAENVFGCRFIKVPYSGGTYKEMNDNLKVAIAHNPNLKIIIRGLDMGKFIEDKDAMREDLGKYPTYLYNDNPLDDVQYIFNRDVIFKTVYGMVIANDEEGFTSGITPFDAYSNWMKNYTFGVNSSTLFPNGIPTTNKSVTQVDITEEQKEIVLGNVRQNVTSLAEANPDVTFYYFFTPYSAAWWQGLINAGTFNKQIQAEQIEIEEILKVDNIKLFSFNNLKEITTDLNNYKDIAHYAEWINSLMLKYMKDERCLLTQQNYEEYLQAEKEFYWNFDYDTCFNTQEDFEQDYYSAALLNEEINSIIPYQFSRESIEESEIQNASIVEEQYNGEFGISCKGTLSRPSGSEVSVPNFIIQNNEFDGARISIDDISEYKYLIAYGKKITNCGQPSIFIYDENGTVVGQTSAGYSDLDGEWHQYLIDVSMIKGKVDIVFHGGYVDSTGSQDSEFVFSNITLY